jgi:hypothetical protein
MTDDAARKEDLDKANRRINELAGQVQNLQRQLAAEQEVVAAIRNGPVSIPGIAAALRSRAEDLTRLGQMERGMSAADFDRNLFLGRVLQELAAEIEGR